MQDIHVMCTIGSYYILIILDGIEDVRIYIILHHIKDIQFTKRKIYILLIIYFTMK